MKLNIYECDHFLLFCLYSTLLIYHFHYYSMLFLLLYLCFPLASLHRHTKSGYFPHFHPDFPHSHTGTALKVSKYGVFSGPYFLVFGMNADQKNLRIWTLFTQYGSPHSYSVYCISSFRSPIPHFNFYR